MVSTCVHKSEWKNAVGIATLTQELPCHSGQPSLHCMLFSYNITCSDAGTILSHLKVQRNTFFILDVSPLMVAVTTEVKGD